jgi:hypothetical protein
VARQDPHQSLQPHTIPSTIEMADFQAHTLTMFQQISTQFSNSLQLLQHQMASLTTEINTLKREKNEKPA